MTRVETSTSHKRYLVKARSLTALRVPTLQRFNVANSQLDVSNWTSRDAGGEFHRGLLFDVMLDAESHDAARAAARPILEQVQNALAFAMAVGISHAEPVISFSDQEGGVSVLQDDELPVVSAARRHLDRDRFRRFWDALNATDSEVRERLDRGMAWYRKGMFEAYVLDRFQSWWNGLEALNPRIQARHGLPTLGEPQSCPDCGAAVPGRPIASGIQHAIEAVADHETWTVARRARVGVVHAVRPLAETVGLIQQVLDPVGAALRWTILDLLNVPERERAAFDATPMEIPRQYMIRHKYVLNDVPFESVGSGGDYPQMPLIAVEASRHELANGRVQERVSPRYGPAPAAFEAESLTVEGWGDPDDVQATFEFEEPRILSTADSARPEMASEDKPVRNPPS